MSVVSRTIGAAEAVYDAIVVGSGYGGGVAASRLSRMGLRVAVLEQGRHWRPGDFPVTAKDRRKQSRLTGCARPLGDPAGLYYFSVGKGLTVFGASGLGGGSLINAGVALRPDVERLRRVGWPTETLADGLLERAFAHAETMLGVGPAPEPNRFPRYAGMQRMAEASGRPVHLPSMTISHKPGPNVSGVMQYGCRYCGDCWSGCNAGAKNTVGITYIVDAVDHGASVFCESRARHIAKREDGWDVTVEDLSRPGTESRLSASILVLAAGTLGTNELLLRAASCGLPLSKRLGQGFSANGDDLVIASDLPQPVHAIAVGFPAQAPRGTAPVGPHSMAMIDAGDADGAVWLHDGTMLRLMAALTPLKDLLELNVRSAIRLRRQGIDGDQMSRTQLFYVVADDDASGTLSLHKDRVKVEWPGYNQAPRRLRAEAKAKALIERAGGEFNDNPFVLSAFGGNRIIAHPLGGAAMGATAETGVIAHDGRVFDPAMGATTVHQGLYVCDGSAIPTAVGVSPLLTITALAERAMTLTAERLNRRLDRDTQPSRPLRDAAT